MTSIVLLLMLASTGVLATVEAVIVTIGSIQTVLGVVEAVLVASSSSPHVTGDLEAGVSAGLEVPLPVTVSVAVVGVVAVPVSPPTLSLLHLVVGSRHLCLLAI